MRNSPKSESLFRGRLIGPPKILRLEDQNIEWVSRSRLLGVTVDNKLTWSHHNLEVKKDFANKFSLIEKSRFLHKNTLLDLYFKKVKVGRNKMAKHYGVIFTCLNTRAVHCELATDLTTMEFLQVLRRFFSYRGYPKVLISYNGSQMVGTEHELHLMTEGWDNNQLKGSCRQSGNSSLPIPHTRMGVQRLR